MFVYANHILFFSLFAYKAPMKDRILSFWMMWQDIYKKSIIKMYNVCTVWTWFDRRSYLTKRKVVCKNCTYVDTTAMFPFPPILVVQSSLLPAVSQLPHYTFVPFSPPLSLLFFMASTVSYSSAPTLGIVMLLTTDGSSIHLGWRVQAVHTYVCLSTCAWIGIAIGIDGIDEYQM